MPDYPFSLSSKLPRTGTTIFSKMSALAHEHDAINLSQGFPNFDVPEGLKSLVTHYTSKGHNQYAPMAGTPELRRAVADLRKENTRTSYDVESEITITAGATQAIFTAVMALIREDDEVIIFTPAYDCYAPAVELAGGKPIYVKMKAPDYRIDWEEVKKVVTRKTRMIIINTPHNPTGAVLKQNDLNELVQLVSGSDIILLCDEVYEHMVFDGQKHLSCAADKTLAKHALVIGSFGKTFHATGWKVGYIAGPSQLIAEFRKVHQYNVFSVNTPVQLALAEFIENEPKHIEELPAFYQQKRDVFLNALEGSRFTWRKTPGTYFQILHYGSISKADDVVLAEKWTKEHKIAAIPISVFYHQPEHNQVLRFCFAKNDEVLIKAAHILKEL